MIIFTESEFGDWLYTPGNMVSRTKNRRTAEVLELKRITNTDVINKFNMDLVDWYRGFPFVLSLERYSVWTLSIQLIKLIMCLILIRILSNVLTISNFLIIFRLLQIFHAEYSKRTYIQSTYIQFKIAFELTMDEIGQTGWSKNIDLFN